MNRLTERPQQFPQVVINGGLVMVGQVLSQNP